MEPSNSIDEESRTTYHVSDEVTGTIASEANNITSNTHSDNESCLSTEEQYDSLLAESIIRARTELLRNEWTQLSESSSSNDSDIPPVPSSFRESASLGSERLHDALANRISEQSKDNDIWISKSQGTGIPKKLENESNDVCNKSTSFVSVNSHGRSYDDNSHQTDPTIQSHDSTNESQSLNTNHCIMPIRRLNSERFVPITAFSVPAPQREVVVAEQVSIELDDRLDVVAKPMQRRYMIFAALIICVVTSAIVALTLGGLCASGHLKCGDAIVAAAPSNKTSLDHQGSSIYNFIQSISRDSNQTRAKEEAIDWIIEDEARRHSSSNNSLRLIQRYALASVWFHSISNNKWENSDSWLSEYNECTWYGITCTDIDHGSDIGVQKTVTNISLISNNVNGMIPEDISLLSKLRYLYLINNAITGTLPNFIDQLTDLLYLHVGSNRFTGTLPESIGNLKNLEHLDVSGNSFTGSIPITAGYLTNLSTFNVRNNSISSTFPSSCGMWTDIKYVDLARNMLTGQLPESIGNWKSINYFSAGSNDFTGTLPAGIWNWTSLSVLSIFGNEFSGTFPSEINNWDNIQTIVISGNNFTGSIPFDICPENLTVDHDDTVQSKCH